jgi:hypothetical protein
MRTFLEALEQRLCLSVPHPGAIRHNSPEPYGLIAVAQPNATIDLSWSDDHPAVNLFLVQRSTGSERFTTIARVRAAMSYADSHVAVDTTYNYRIYAANVATPSATATAGILNVSLVTTLNSVQISWQPLSNSPQGYSVYRSLASSTSGNSPFSLVLVGSTTGTTLTDTPPDDGNTYNYLVESTSGDAGGSVPVTIWPVPVSSFASTTFLGSDSHYSVELTWTTTSQFVSEFEIERSSDGGVTWPVVYYVPAPATQFIDTDVPDGVSLQYQIAELPS